MKKRMLSLQEERQEKLIVEAYQILRRAKVNNNLSDKTIKHYDDIMELLGKFLNNIGERYCSEISIDTIEEFIKFFKTRNPDIRATSINSGVLSK